MMEIFEEYLLNAKKKYLSAEHMVSVTYGITKDPKILISVLNDCFNAVSNAMDAILALETSYGIISGAAASPDGDFDEKISLFVSSVAPSLCIEKKHIDLIKTLHDYVSGHRNSPIEFSKDGAFIICDDEYKMKTIDLEDTIKLVSESKSFINLTDTLVKGRDVIHRRSKK